LLLFVSEKKRKGLQLRIAKGEDSALVYLEKNVVLYLKLCRGEKFDMGLSRGRERVISCDWPRPKEGKCCWVGENFFFFFFCG
jgi:hypothetical protein